MNIFEIYLNTFMNTFEKYSNTLMNTIYLIQKTSFIFITLFYTKTVLKLPLPIHLLYMSELTFCLNMLYKVYFHYFIVNINCVKIDSPITN